jgi:hypothetical protein
MNILIFKTDIANRYHYSNASQVLQNIPGILRWTVDMEDVDHVLRIETLHLEPANIEKPLAQAGYYCREMED